jgi:pimeloyl-ACP methyl ester carboxylesterase
VKIQHISVDGQQVRVAVRAGAADGVPLLLINGIGASLEVPQPFTDALDPALTVIRFDVPGTGGSPLPQRPYRFGGSGTGRPQRRRSCSCTAPPTG